MAREQRKDVDYFPHECTHGRKMHIIETKFGNDGYATWFKLLEQLGKANNHYLDISDETNLMFLSSVFKISDEKTLEILDCLAKLGSIDKYLFDTYQVIFSEKFTNSVLDAYRKRTCKCFQYSDILGIYESKSAQSGAGLNQNQLNPAEVIPKEKNSKEKNSIIKLHCDSDESQNSQISNSSKDLDNITEPKKEKKVAPKKESLPPKPKPKASPYWKELVEIWFNFYQERFKEKPTFSGAASKCLKEIVNNMQKAVEGHREEWTEERASKALNKFLTNAWEDDWLKKHFLLTILSSKYDSIINKIKVDGKQSNTNGTTTKQSYSFSAQRVIAANLGNTE